MKISYKNNMQDIIDINIYNANNSSITKRQLRISLFLMPFAFICYLIYFYIIYREVSPTLLVGAIIISILWVVFYPKNFRWRVSRVVTKRVNEGNNKNVFSNTFLTIDDEGITKESDLINSKVLWLSIEKVVVTVNHIFIFVNFANAFIIPLKVFKSSTEKDSFLQFIYKNTR